MAMCRLSPAFPSFPSLPPELRLTVFDQALLPLLQPRIIDVYATINVPVTCYRTFRSLYSFSAKYTPFVREIDSYVTSAETLSRVCRESRAAVQDFQRRHGLLEPQPSFFSQELAGLSPEVSLRPQGPYADIFLWYDSCLLEEQGMTSRSAAGRDLGLATRWLMPVDNLTQDLRYMELDWSHDLHDWPVANGHSYIKNALLMSPHDIIAFVTAVDNSLLLCYSDLIIISADACREMAIDGLDNGDRDFILEKFEHCKRSLRIFEAQRLSHQRGQPDLVPARVFPDLYFAYVNPLKRRSLTG